MEKRVTGNTKTFGIGLKDKIGYALGDTGGLLTFTLVSSFLQMFYTDVLFIEAGKITLLFLIARLWDAVNDPLWGAIIDSRKTGKNGKFRPYLKYVSYLLSIFGFLMFVKIPGLSQNQYLIYAYVTYICYGMMYTAINIPYGSLASVITTDESERSALSMFRSIGAGIGGLPAQIILPLFVFSTVAQGGEKYLDGNKLLAGVAVLAVFTVISYQFCYKMTSERVVSAATEDKMKIGKTIKALLKNRPFIVLCIVSMCIIATQQYTQTLYNYLFKDYFSKPELYALVTVFTYLPMVLLLPVLQKIVARFGKKEVCAAGLALATVANLILWIINTQSVGVFLALCFFSGLGLSFFILEVWALATDVIDYQETLSGQRDEGTSYAFFSFMRKLGQTAAGVLGTQVLVIIGYSAKNLTATAVENMYTAATAVPVFTCLIATICLAFFYPLSKEKLLELKNIQCENN